MQNRIPIMTTLCGADAALRAIKSLQGSEVQVRALQENHSSQNGCDRQLHGHSDEVVRAAFSPDGNQIVTASKDKTARLWSVLPADAGLPPAWFCDFLDHLAQKRINAGGEFEIIRVDDWLLLWPKPRLIAHKSGEKTRLL